MDDTNNTTFNSSSSNSTYDSWQSSRPPKSFWTNLTLPVLYLTILIGSLYAFSSLYRKRKLQRAASLESWFSQHKQRDVYLSLLHLDPAEASEGEGEKKLKQVPDSLLKAALLRRALEDIQRIVQLRGAKPALQTLLQRGSVGDELWQRFLRAEKEMEEEVKDVVNEANAFAPNWGQTIFQSANEMNQNILLKQRAAEVSAQLEGERAWWEGRRAGIQSDFMKELEGESKPADAAPKKTSSDDDAVLVDGGGPGDQQGARKRKGKK
ncbi:Translocation protein S66 [Saxophila tyrrhenica]|uniref:Translocation protein S66 n=1 Tax=Saxophila tyrrhenica TaxID=1690608 RepID=A0AAV9PFF1_9PEZI|nr:Translocation protein S66 [Saxophila tyrrhenica]